MREDSLRVFLSFWWPFGFALQFERSLNTWNTEHGTCNSINKVERSRNYNNNNNINVVTILLNKHCLFPTAMCNDSIKPNANMREWETFGLCFIPKCTVDWTNPLLSSLNANLIKLKCLRVWWDIAVPHWYSFLFTFDNVFCEFSLWKILGTRSTIGFYSSTFISLDSHWNTIFLVSQ